MSGVKEQPELYLQEIDPSPLDELDLEAADGSSIAAGRQHELPSRPKLGLSGHSWEYWRTLRQGEAWRAHDAKNTDLMS